jgi:hypothetical protein
MYPLHKLYLTIAITFILCNASATQTNQSDSAHFICVSSFKLPDGPVNFIEDNHGHIIIVCRGKKGLIGILKDTIMEPLVQGYIDDAVLGVDGNIWYIGQNKISSVSFTGKMTNNNLISKYFGDNKPNKINLSSEPLFYKDRLGNIWFSNTPYRIGADMMSRPNPQSAESYEKYPLPQTTDPFGNMWGLIAADDSGNKDIGVIPSGELRKWTVFDKNNGFPSGQWNAVIADIEGMIWVSGKSGLLSFDPRKPKRGWLAFPANGQYPGGAVTFLTLSSNGHVLLGLQSGGLYEVNVDAKDVPIVKQVPAEGLPKDPLNALYTDRAGRIWVVANNKLYRQDKLPLAWQPLTPMPYGNHDVFGVELNGKIYIPGGGAYHGFPVVSENFDCLLIYDIKNDHWEISPKMPTNRRYCSVGLLDGKIWVIGGFNKSDKIPEKEGRMWNDSPINTVEIYDPVQRSWTAGPSLDVPRAETVACMMAGRLYVFGSTGNEIYKTLSIGPGEKQWRAEPAAPYPVFQTTGCVLNNQTYIMAGGNGLIIYDPETQTWQKDIPLIPGSKPPFSSIVVKFNKDIWVISGRGNDDGTKAWIYSPVDKKWRSGPSFPYPTMWANGIEVNGRLYIFGGATMSKIRNTYLYWDAIRVLNN